MSKSLRIIRSMPDVLMFLIKKLIKIKLSYDLLMINIISEDQLSIGNINCFTLLYKKVQE